MIILLGVHFAKLIPQAQTFGLRSAVKDVLIMVHEICGSERKNLFICTYSGMESVDVRFFRFNSFCERYSSYSVNTQVFHCNENKIQNYFQLRRKTVDDVK